MDDVLRAESVVRGRCRAIVRVPWDDLLSSRSGPNEKATPYQQALQPQTRLAYTALAGVLVTSLAATHVSPSREGTVGQHAD